MEKMLTCDDFMALLETGTIDLENIDRMAREESKKLADYIDSQIAKSIIEGTDSYAREREPTNT